MGVRERITASLTRRSGRAARSSCELNVELLKAELKKKAQEYGGAIGMLAAAALLALYALGFALATIAVALALVLPSWLSLLIVTLVLFLIIAILILAGRRASCRSSRPRRPRRPPAEAKITAATVEGRSHEGRRIPPAEQEAGVRRRSRRQSRTGETVVPGETRGPGVPPPEVPPTEAGS